MAAKKKYYVVWEGHEPGIYDTWEKCQLQIKGYPGAKYKSFKSEEEALNAFHGDYSDFTKKKEKALALPMDLDKEIEENSWAVDAACSGNPGKMEYRGVITRTGEELFRQGPGGLTHEFETVGQNGPLAGLGAKKRSADLDEITHIQSFEQRVGLVADLVLAHIGLQ